MSYEVIHLASFNLFWFPESGKAMNHRSETDRQQIARIVQRLGADALVFQEILDVAALGATLGQIVGRSYRVIQGDATLGPGSMRVAAAFDESKLVLRETKSIAETDAERQFNHRRPPLALRLFDKASEREFWFVGVHLKSEDPNSTGPDAKRRWECELLAKWARERDDEIPLFILGDFNLTSENELFESLTRQDAPVKLLPTRVLAGLPEAGASEVKPSERWSTLLDQVVIDHAFHAGGEDWLSGGAVVVAFDLDPELAEPRDGQGLPFFRSEDSGYDLIPSGGAGVREVRNMYRVSDHRPIRIALKPP